MRSNIRIQSQDFDLSAEYSELCSLSRDVGAVVCFTGLVREMEGSDHLQSLELQHYPGMTERLLQDIVDKAAERWPLQGVTVIHRVGAMAPNEQIVLVAVASGHRGEAFAAAEYIMDYLKTRATFWKRVNSDGESHWVDARESDQQAVRRWDGDK